MFKAIRIGLSHQIAISVALYQFGTITVKSYKLLCKTCGMGRRTYVRSCPGLCNGGRSYKIEHCNNGDCPRWTG